MPSTITTAGATTFLIALLFAALAVLFEIKAKQRPAEILIPIPVVKRRKR